MKFSLALHLVGIIMWLGGLLMVTRFMALTCCDQKPAGDVAAAVKKLFFGWVMGGLALATATGLYQVLSVGLSVYMKQGWFHGKLTLIIALMVVSILTLIQVKQVAGGQSVAKSKIMAFHGIAGICMLGIIVLTMVAR
jgi:uncharacterized membrane protein